MRRSRATRTCISAVLPEKSCSCNTLATLDVGEIDLHVAAAVLTSFAFDFLTRPRPAGTHLNWTYVSRGAVPSAMECSSLPSIETLSADGADAPERDERYFNMVWQANRAVAEAYGLSAADLEHILSRFPVFARKRPGFHTFLLARLQEWAST